MKNILEARINDWSSIGHPAILERFVFAKGREYQMIPWDGEPGTPKECFCNATHAVWDDSLYSYVEGYIFSKEIGMLIHHAWVEDADGMGMDPTLSLERSKGYSYYGVQFSDKILYEELDKSGVYGLLDTGMINFDLISRMYPEIEKVVESFRKKRNIC